MSTISGISSSYLNATMMQNAKKPSADEMFSKIDTDGDGSISEAELTAMQEDIAAQTGQTVDAVSYFSDYDADDDGLLAREEMDNLMATLHESMGPPPPPPPADPEMAAQAYLANSGSDEDQVSTILDLMDQYLEQLEEGSEDDEDGTSA